MTNEQILKRLAEIQVWEAWADQGAKTLAWLCVCTLIVCGATLL